MSKELIIWDEAITSTDLKEVGVAFKAFEGCKHLVVAKPDKRAVVMFMNAEGKVRTVITTSKVNELYRAGKISKVQLLSLIVLRNDNFKTKDGVKADAPVFMLSLPATGWSEMGATKEMSSADWEALANV